MGINCDYQAEIKSAMQMAGEAANDIERFEWLFLARAWQALARCRDETFPRDIFAPDSGEHPVEPLPTDPEKTS